MCICACDQHIMNQCWKPDGTVMMYVYKAGKGRGYNLVNSLQVYSHVRSMFRYGVPIHIIISNYVRMGLAFSEAVTVFVFH